MRNSSSVMSCLGRGGGRTGAELTPVSRRRKKKYKINKDDKHTDREKEILFPFHTRFYLLLDCHARCDKPSSHKSKSRWRWLVKAVQIKTKRKMIRKKKKKKCLSPFYDLYCQSIRERYRDEKKKKKKFWCPGKRIRINCHQMTGRFSDEEGITCVKNCVCVWGGGSPKPECVRVDTWMWRREMNKN